MEPGKFGHAANLAAKATKEAIKKAAKKTVKMKPEKYGLLDNLRYIAGFCWKNDRLLFGLLIFNTLFRGILPFVGVLTPKYLIDELTGLRRPAAFAVILLIALAVELICKLGTDRIASSLWRRVIRLRCRLMDIRGKKAMTMNFVNTENPEVLSRFEKSYIATGENISVDMRGVESIMHNLFHLPSHILTLLGYIYITTLLNPLILLVLIAGVAISYILNLKANKYEHKLMDEKGEYRKQERYFEEKFLDFKLAKDIRLFGLDKLMMKKFKKAGYSSLNLTKKYYKKEFKVAFATLLIDFVREGLVYVYLAYNVIKNGMGIGNFSMYLQAVTNFSGALTNILNIFAEIVHRDLYMKDFRIFLDMPDDYTQPLDDYTQPMDEEIRQIDSRTQPLDDKTHSTDDKAKPIYNKKRPIYDNIPEAVNYKIEFENIYFKYPGAEHYVFSDFSMAIEPGQRLAVVGLNGAGKSTLVKLMTRLYEPEKGRILLNGVDIRSYSKEAVYKLFSVVFQDVNLFAFTIAENVSMRSARDTDKNLAAECLSYVGLTELVQNLEYGIDHSVLKVLDPKGIELSGGQAQKLALARAIYKNGKIIVLDEPTAALDALAEYEIYKSFDQLIGNKTAVYISHRLSSTRFCDSIVYMENGKIVECGTHSQLMNMKGKYADMFEKQAYYYKDNNKSNKNSKDTNTNTNSSSSNSSNSNNKSKSINL